MTHARAEQLERNLLAERSRLERELERLTTPPTDAAGGHGRFGDDEVASAAGSSADVDRAIAVQTSRELDDVERALTQLREDPEHFGRCAVCNRPIALEPTGQVAELLLHVIFAQRRRPGLDRRTVLVRQWVCAHP